MNKIVFPRKDVDGECWSQEKIENWYLQKITELISKKLKKIRSTKNNNVEKTLLRILKKRLQTILVASPQKIALWIEIIDKYRPHLTNRFIRRIGEAFNYDYYRSNVLIELAKKLNVKCCPYCNMHYTLYAEESAIRLDQLAKFQFDHFFSKNKYPMLSMSLYNLIPSCALCNQGKSDKRLSLLFHPYYSYICKQFKFELDNPIDLYSGRKVSDHIDVNLVATGSNQSELDEFAQTFHLKALYQRHGDVAQEAFDKAYEYPYYCNPDNFKWLSNHSAEYIKRLWMGTYPDEKDIEKRPMTKFIQDLWEQAWGIRLSIETVI